MKELTKAEEILLLSILRLQKKAYGVAIKKEIQQSTGRAFAYGTLYFILEQLSNKGFVTKEKGNPTPERGGRSKTFYKLTDKGFNTLKSSFEMHQKAWKGFAGIKWKEIGK
ncbi:MAG: helix-turn-helix transcriptional regulator [Candidatus Aminicenantes bacterium]|nr:MAG: helix-turn-helix transcriptional regulator [Candidatus Aminicenantes bacterium]